MTYGSSRLNIPAALHVHSGDISISDAHTDLVFRNVCRAKPQTADDSVCSNLILGTLVNGLHISVREFTRLCQELLIITEHLPPTWAFFKVQFNLQIFLDLRLMESNFLQLAMTQDLELQADALNAQLDLFHTNHLVLSLSFFLSFQLLMMLMYLPMVQHLDRQDKHTRTMLLCIPNDVLDRIESISEILSADV